MLQDKAMVEASLVSAHRRASFLASSSQHSGDWLFALPIASCGLRLDDEAVRVAIGLKLGLELCVPHQYYCGSPVDARGLHSFVCKKAPGRSAIHHRPVNHSHFSPTSADSVLSHRQPKDQSAILAFH